MPLRLPVSRRLVLAGALLLAGCGGDSGGWYGTDVSGSTPDLAFRLTRASDGKPVTEAAYRGTVTLLYFGYTFCPDVCPMTLSNVARALKPLGADAAKVRVLFVTIDPQRDSLAALRQYVSAFGPEFVGLRGSNDEIATLAKRYRVAWSVHADPDPARYVVTHSSALYAFDRDGKARLLLTSLSSDKPDIAGTTADLKRLIAPRG